MSSACVHPLLDRHRIEVVDHQEARDQLVVLAISSRVPASASSTIRSSPAPYICTTADVSSSARLRHAGIVEVLQPPRELLHTGYELLGLHGHGASAVGVWTTFRTGPLPAVHVHAARQARVERAHRPHDVDPLEVLRAVLLEDRRVLHRVLVGAGSPVDVARARVPRRRRVGLVVRDLAVLDHHVVREDAAGGLVEAHADRRLRHLELVPALGAAGLDLLHRPLQVVQRDQRRVGLVVGARAVALDRVRLLRAPSTPSPSRACSASAAAPSGCCRPVALA